MVPGSNPPKRKSHRAKKRAHPSTLNEFMQEAERLRDRALTVLQADGHHGSMVFTWRRDGCREIIGVSLDERFAGSMGDLVRVIVKTRDVVCFVVVSESWMTRGPAAASGVMPSQSPEKEQVLSISAIHPEGKAMWCYPFASEGGRVVIGTPISSEGLTLGGAIPEALDKKEGDR